MRKALELLVGRVLERLPADPWDCELPVCLPWPTVHPIRESVRLWELPGCRRRLWDELAARSNSSTCSSRGPLAALAAPPLASLVRQRPVEDVGCRTCAAHCRVPCHTAGHCPRHQRMVGQAIGDTTLDSDLEH